MSTLFFSSFPMFFRDARSFDWSRVRAFHILESDGTWSAYGYPEWSEDGRTLFAYLYEPDGNRWDCQWTWR